MPTTTKPTRREERRAQTVREIKQLAMDQVATGGPDAVSLSGIVREMSMSPAAIYRYFASRDALLADLVVDAYNELADFLSDIGQGDTRAGAHLDEVLRGSRSWALEHPNAYRLVFQTSIGSGKDFAPATTIPAASRSMSVIIDALAAVTLENSAPAESAPAEPAPADTDAFEASVHAWAERSGLTRYSVEVLTLALLTWTRLHGVISLELGGHLSATGIGGSAVFEAEIQTIRARAAQLPPAIHTT